MGTNRGEVTICMLLAALLVTVAMCVGCGGGSATGPTEFAAVGADTTVTDDADCWQSSDGRRCGPNDPTSGAHASAPYAGR